MLKIRSIWSLYLSWRSCFSTTLQQVNKKKVVPRGNDEDITSTDMNTRLVTTLNDGLITRARARQLIYQVNSFLGLSVLFENSMMLPNGDNLLVLRNLGVRPVPEGLRPLQEGLRPLQEGLRPVSLVLSEHSTRWTQSTTRDSMDSSRPVLRPGLRPEIRDMNNE